MASTPQWLPPQDQVMNQPNGLTMWLGSQDDNNFSPDPNVNAFGETIHDLVVPEVAHFDCSSTYYPMAPMVNLGFGFKEGDEYQDHQLLSSSLRDYNVFEGLGDQSGYDNGCYDHCYQVCDNGEEGNACSIFGNHFLTNNNNALSSRESWGSQANLSTIPVSEDQTKVKVKVGRYSVEERRDRILRYLKKRNQRNFNKTVKYACRKTLADRRVRVRGRFAKNYEEESQTTNSNNLVTPQEKSLALQYADKNEEYFDNEWLQDAMSSLMYVPFIPGWQGGNHSTTRS